MKLLRNDDVIIVGDKTYQFEVVDDDNHCRSCAFYNSLSVCKLVHCVGEDRIDQLTGHFKKI